MSHDHSHGQPATHRTRLAIAATILLGVGIYAVIEGVLQLLDPTEITAVSGQLAFGIIGMAGNLASMLVLSAGRGANLNLRAAFLEVVNDALGRDTLTFQLTPRFTLPT